VRLQAPHLQTGSLVPLPQRSTPAHACAQRSTARAVSFFGPSRNPAPSAVGSGCWGSPAATVAPGPQGATCARPNSIELVPGLVPRLHPAGPAAGSPAPASPSADARCHARGLILAIPEASGVLWWDRWQYTLPIRCVRGWMRDQEGQSKE
jgi:hypothetical protein